MPALNAAALPPQQTLHHLRQPCVQETVHRTSSSSSHTLRTLSSRGCRRRVWEGGTPPSQTHTPKKRETKRRESDPGGGRGANPDPKQVASLGWGRGEERGLGLRNPPVQHCLAETCSNKPNPAKKDPNRAKPGPAQPGPTRAIHFFIFVSF